MSKSKLVVEIITQIIISVLDYFWTKKHDAREHEIHVKNKSR